MLEHELFLNLWCIFCFVKWGGKWKKCQKKCKKSCFFLQHVSQKLKKYRFRHGLHLLLSRQKWKKTLKKTCFFHVFLHCFFAFCLDLRWTRAFWTGFRMLSWLLDLSMYDRSNHAEATISTLSFQKLQTFLEFWTYCATFFSSKCHFEPQSLIYHNKWLSWAFLAPEDDFYLFFKNFW